MSDKNQDRKPQYQVTNPVIPDAAKVISASGRDKSKLKNCGAVESEGINDVNDATMSITW